MHHLFTKAGFCLVMLANAGVRAQTTPLPKSTGAMSLKLPQLVEGGGQMGLVRAIQLKVKYPNSALRAIIQG